MWHIHRWEIVSAAEEHFRDGWETCVLYRCRCQRFFSESHLGKFQSAISPLSYEERERLKKIDVNR